MLRFTRLFRHGCHAHRDEIPEAKGVVDAVVRLTAPVLKPFGISGIAIFALIQLNFVSFAAPIAALAIMEKRGTSERQLAAALAMYLRWGQGNVFYPLIPYGCTGEMPSSFRFLVGWSPLRSLIICSGKKLSSTVQNAAPAEAF